MTERKIRIATRASPLAVWQAEYVAKCLQANHPGMEVALVRITTRGDQILDAPLARIGGKGLFVKELEQAMLAGEADLAVHSMKDVPMVLPDGMTLAVICEREDPHDAFVSNDYADLDSLPQGARVGTASLRRQAMVKARRPDIEVLTLRGNVQTRLSKLDRGDFHAILLAAAGLKRLGLDARIRSILPPEVSLPAVGQGAVGIECREDDQALRALLAPLAHKDTWDRVTAERALNRRLEGGCQVPIAGYAMLDNDELWLRGLVASEDGTRVFLAENRAARQDAAQLGTGVAESLLEQGAGEVLASLSQH